MARRLRMPDVCLGTMLTYASRMPHVCLTYALGGSVFCSRVLSTCAALLMYYFTTLLLYLLLGYLLYHLLLCCGAPFSATTWGSARL